MSSHDLHIMLDKVLDFIVKDIKGNSGHALTAFSNCSHLYKEIQIQKKMVEIGNEREKMQLQRTELDFKLAIYDLNNFLNSMK
jgi:hypothetical protein